MLKNTKMRRQAKRESAELRQAVYNKLSLKEKLTRALLNSKGTESREVRRLRAKEVANG